jgi:hypothetical protein
LVQRKNYRGERVDSEGRQDEDFFMLPLRALVGAPAGAMPLHTCAFVGGTSVPMPFIFAEEHRG